MSSSNFPADCLRFIQSTNTEKQGSRAASHSSMARGEAEVAADNAAIVARLSAVLATSPFQDTALVSERDGTKTPAAAIMLASCSPVFLKMLTGRFAEGVGRGVAKSKTSLDTDTSTSSPPSALPVSCAFSGEALGAVVAFSATNDAPALWDGSAGLLGELLEASEYYDIADLKVKAKRRLVARARDVPVEACGVLEAVWERWGMDELGSGSAGEIAEAALAVIDESANVALTGCGCLCEEAMKKVLGGQNICASEVVLFRALERWVSVDTKKRKTPGERLVSCLSLELMPPSFLVDVVATSGLVSKEMISDIFVTQALKAEIDNGFNVRDRGISASSLPTWDSAGSVEFTSESDGWNTAALDRSLSSGCWSWDLRVEQTCTNFCIGLATTADLSATSFLGDQKGGYAYVRDGHCYLRDFSSVGGPPFGEGDTVRVILDCDAGTLRTSVNGGEHYEASTGISQVGDGKTFRPAVSLVSPGRVRLLNFSRLSPS